MIITMIRKRRVRLRKPFFNDNSPYFKRGSTRYVFLLGNYAIKVPTLSSYVYFLLGLIGNADEVHRYKLSKTSNSFPTEKLCPIVFHLPLGLMVVMKRAKPLTKEEFDRLDYSSFVGDNNAVSLNIIEKKCESFGYVDNKIVAVDYALKV